MKFQGVNKTIWLWVLWDVGQYLMMVWGFSFRACYVYKWCLRVKWNLLYEMYMLRQGTTKCQRRDLASPHPKK